DQTIDRAVRARQKTHQISPLISDLRPLLATPSCHAEACVGGSLVRRRVLRSLSSDLGLLTADFRSLRLRPSCRAVASAKADCPPYFSFPFRLSHFALPIRISVFLLPTFPGSP